jgi:hypothetical protein
MNALQVGPGLDTKSQLGPSVSIKERDKVAALVDQAIASGATVETGGKVPTGPGAFYPATVIHVEVGTKFSDQLLPSSPSKMMTRQFDWPTPVLTDSSVTSSPAT